ncbi:hypothetical protein M565_ctg1P0601 [Vibrio cyclitrophicus FF75]|nr:hypothetical protein M565_ctg1P0601 [Vibrio cyclitrophicus FF75]
MLKLITFICFYTSRKPLSLLVFKGFLIWWISWFIVFNHA